MDNQIEIKLTEDQIKQLDLLEDKVLEAFEKGKRGAIMAQVVPSYGKMSCCFCTYDDVEKMYKALGRRPPGE